MIFNSLETLITTHNSSVLTVLKILSFVYVASLMGALLILVRQYYKDKNYYAQQLSETNKMLQEHGVLLNSLQDKIIKRDVALATLTETIVYFSKDMKILLGQDVNRSKDYPYRYALKLLKDGVDINQVMDKCNLSRGEADVLQALHMKDIAQFSIT